MLIKVMAGKLFFKPYKIVRFFEKDMSDLIELGELQDCAMEFDYRNPNPKVLAAKDHS